MKEYNRKTKKWEEKSTEQVGDIKKKEMCRGGQAHKMKIVLPDHIMRTNRDLPEEVILAWYESQDRIYFFIAEETLRMNSLGIVYKVWNHVPHKNFKCEVCGKKDYQI